ncbi:hypothetical protein J6590_098066, partial [Homalodisca vitripennis]
RRAEDDETPTAKSPPRKKREEKSSPKETENCQRLSALKNLPKSKSDGRDEVLIEDGNYLRLGVLSEQKEAGTNWMISSRNVRVPVPRLYFVVRKAARGRLIRVSFKSVVELTIGDTCKYRQTTGSGREKTILGRRDSALECWQGVDNRWLQNSLLSNPIAEPER